MYQLLHPCQLCLLNMSGGYVKTIVCNMTSDVKLSQYFLLIKVKCKAGFLTLKSFKKQFESTTHSVMQGFLYGWVYITANCLYFNFNVLKFELHRPWLHYKWIPLRIFFCAYRVSQLLCHIVDGAYEMKYSQK